MSRSLLFVAAIALTLKPEACAKKKDPSAEVDPPPPLPVTSATTPPIWHPPEPPPTAPVPSTSTSAAPTVNPELTKARAAAEAKEFKKVKALLERKVLRGDCLPEESQLLFKACVALKDKKCSDAVKAKHPEDITE